MRLSFNLRGGGGSLHYHGYLWIGSKHRFDDEALRRPPHPGPPPAHGKSELVQRYKEVATEFPVVDLPPLETAHWLIKPSKLVRGTWKRPEEAAGWFGQRLAEFESRFAFAPDRESARMTEMTKSAYERIGWGGDVSHGYYLERPLFLSLALVCCSSNRTLPTLDCPLQ